MSNVAERSYDYVIVGAGAAGCVLAARLTEDPGVTVLLLEAGGPDRTPNIHMPAGFVRTFQTRYDWNYLTQAQAHAGGRRLYWPRGKVLGGSTSINAMVYMRGSAADYDAWAAAGNAGWSFRDVLPYFLRAEDNENGASPYHGVGGPLAVSNLRDPHPWSEAFVEACLDRGFPHNPDFNGPGQTGAGLYQVTQRQGRRCSTAVGYLRPALRRPNLTVLTHALAVRLRLARDVCAGVEYQRGGRTGLAVANAEVILAGGTVNTPQLLLLSGIGPGSHLREVGIPVRHDLPGVGEGLQDHPVVNCVFRTTSPRSLLAAESPRHLIRYLVSRRGLLTSNISEAALFTTSRPGLAEADLQFNFAPVRIENHGLAPGRYHAFTIGVVLVHVASRGRLRLRSSDPTHAPAIDPNYLAAEEDVTALTSGVRLAREIAAEHPLAGLVDRETVPGAEHRGSVELADGVRRHVHTLYHPVSTCRMGVDDLAVVDPHLRVRGIKRLRVVDASVMPTLVRGNTNAPTIMIAERAADLIRQSVSPRTSHTAR